MHAKKYRLLFFIPITIFTLMALFSVQLFNSPDVSYAAPLAGVISGTVFRDYNANGGQDPFEPGIMGVEVTAVDNLGNSVSITTAPGGTYTLASLPGDEARVEFTLPMGGALDFLRPGAAGASTVQFIDISGGDVANVDVGFNNPGQYGLSVNPQVAIPTWAKGNNATQPGVGVMLTHAYLDNGDIAGGVALTVTADADEVGTLYGLAYQPSSGVLFGGSYIRRGSGMGATDSTGAIYKLSGAGAPSSFIDLNALGVSSLSTGVNPHPNAMPGGDWQADSAAFAMVGKAGLGDLEMSDDDQTLYAVNMLNRTVVIMPLTFDGSGQPIAPSAGNILTRTVPAPPSCNGDGSTAPMPEDLRPFALKFHDGKLYVGAVCSAESMIAPAGLDPATSTFTDLDNSGIRAHMSAYVFEFDPVTNTFNSTPILTVPLDYARERINDNMQSADNDGEWLPWTDYWRPAWRAATSSSPTALAGVPQAMFTDIEFDGNGFMTLGFRDRFGDQAYHNSDPGPNGASTSNQRFGGDNLLACLDGAGNWQLESGSSCTNGLTGEVRTGTGSVDSGYSLDEFYHNEQYWAGGLPAGADYHDETSTGSMAWLPGSGEIIATKYDVFATQESGTIVYDASNGDRLRAVQVTVPNSHFGKAGGTGDIELFRLAAPLELGNRLWCDDGNGVQDPAENSVGAGVDVTLDCGANPVTVSTDANGNYLFTDVLYAAANGGAPIPRNATCTISVDTTGANGTAIQSACGIGIIGTPPSNQTPIGDGNDAIRDSDGDINGTGTLVVTTVNTGNNGENDHTIDFGFIGAADWGDLPDGFDTTTANSGPSHEIVNDLYLGACVDAESDGQPDAIAGVDGVNGDNGGVGFGFVGGCTPAGNDEDGVVLSTPLIPGAQACVEVTAVNGGADANLYGWIDFNGDGDFDGDADELLDDIDFAGGAATVANGGATAQSYCFTVPAGATFDGGETHMRFRLTRDTLGGGAPWNGAAADGEVEDYYAQLACVGNHVWIDLDADGSQNEMPQTGLNGLTMRLVWAGPNNVIDSAPGDATPQADDMFYTTTTANDGATDGMYNFCGLIADAPDTYRVDIPTPPVTYPAITGRNATTDYLDSDGTQTGLGTAVSGVSFGIAMPINLNTGENGTGDNPGSYNNFPDPQDDIAFDFGFLPLDWGDHPDSYDTTGGNNGATHVLTGTLTLGVCVDGDMDGQPGSGATNDDTNAGAPANGGCTGPDDEDGFDAPTSENWSDGTGNVLISVAGGDACLNMWVDFSDGTSIQPNGDGDFNDVHPGPFSEHVLQNEAITTGVGQPYSFPLPAGAADNANWAVRVRLTPRDAGGVCSGADTYPGGAPTPSGPVFGGEVEDYVVSFTPTAISLQRVDATTNQSVTVVAAMLLTLIVGIGMAVALRGRQAQR